MFFAVIRRLCITALTVKKVAAATFLSWGFALRCLFRNRLWRFLRPQLRVRKKKLRFFYDFAAHVAEIE